MVPFPKIDGFSSQSLSPASLAGHDIAFEAQIVSPKLSTLPTGDMGQRPGRACDGLEDRGRRTGNLPELGCPLSPHHHTVHSNTRQIRAAAGGRDKRLGQPEGSG